MDKIAENVKMDMIIKRASERIEDSGGPSQASVDDLLTNLALLETELSDEKESKANQKKYHDLEKEGLESKVLE